MAEYNQIELVQQLKKVVGAVPFDGDASAQVLVPLQGGGYLRVGITDEDVDAGAIWFDRYDGLPLEL